MKAVAINRSPRKKMSTKIGNQMMMIRRAALNVALILLALVAWEVSAQPALPAMPIPGEEAALLSTIFSGNQQWEGIMPADTMGPGSPELPAQGNVVNMAVADKFWFVSDMEVSYGGPQPVMTWRGHLIIGWDESAQAYKGILADNLGIMVYLKGVVEGQKLVLTAEKPGIMMGQEVLARFTYDFSNPQSIRFLNEHQINGGPWNVFEEATLTR